MRGELEDTLADLGVTKADFAKLVGVTVRAVNMWASGEREIPGTVQAYLRLFANLPKAIRAQEIARIRKEDPGRFEGMYWIDMRGKAGDATGMLVLMAGRVFGSDGEVSYDGTYEPSRIRSGFLDVSMRVTVPPGIAIATGRSAQPVEYWFDLQTSFEAQATTSIKAQTPYGVVQVTVRYLRAIPPELAG